MVELKAVVKEFDGVRAVDGVSLRVGKGEFLTLLGPSGCGKTTTLRMIAGFEYPTSGQILLDGKDCAHDPPYRRNVNTVFQSYALFPHMTIEENVAFGLRLKKLPGADVETRVRKALGLVQLEALGGRHPKQVSGGQQQRAAVARALVMDPAVLLLDEPLGALDLKLRKQMQVELKHLQRKLGITFIYVTHDQEEALTMSDRIVVMNKGRIEQTATAVEIYDKPATSFVADFIGETNLIKGVIESPGGNEYVLRSGALALPIRSVEARTNEGKDAFLSIRPERIWFSTGVAMKAYRGTLKEKIYVGSAVKLMVDAPPLEKLVIATQDRESANLVNPGDALNFGWEPEDSHLMLR